MLPTSCQLPAMQLLGKTRYEHSDVTSSQFFLKRTRYKWLVHEAYSHRFLLKVSEKFSNKCNSLLRQYL